MESLPALLADLPIFRDLARTRVLARLEDVSFLGAIDRFSGSNALRAGTRFEHTIGVTYLAFIASLDLKKEERNTAIAAAMLHDIGHGPLSHSTEGIFRSRFSVDHRVAGIRKLQEDKDIKTILIKHRVDQARVQNLAFGKLDDPLSYIFHYPVNVDTIEGITRSANYFGINHLPAEMQVVQLLIKPDARSREAGDKFWKLKDQVYNEHIYSPWLIAIDNACHVALENAQLDENDFLMSDMPFLAKYHDAVFDTLRSLVDGLMEKRGNVDELKRSRAFSITDIEVEEPLDLRLRYK